jgi:hypothetical protein
MDCGTGTQKDGQTDRRKETAAKSRFNSRLCLEGMRKTMTNVIWGCKI